MSIVAIIQARMASTRLPGKILLDLVGEPLISHVIDRVRNIRLLDGFIVATTVKPVDDQTVELCRRSGWPCFRGSEGDVLDRYYQASKHSKAQHIVRVTADCPLVDPKEADRLIAKHLSTGADYTHNLTVWGSGMALGTGCEVLTFEALEASWNEGLQPHHREHVDEYVYEHPELFHIEMISAPRELRRPEFRLTVDTTEDFDLMREIYLRLYRSGEIIAVEDVIGLLEDEPHLLEINWHVLQKVI